LEYLVDRALLPLWSSPCHKWHTQSVPNPHWRSYNSDRTRYSLWVVPGIARGEHEYSQSSLADLDDVVLVVVVVVVVAAFPRNDSLAKTAPTRLLFVATKWAVRAAERNSFGGNQSLA
jgi:hypothetical protein